MNSFIHQYKPSISEAEAKACYDYLISGGWLTEFKQTENFENKICDFTGSKYCIATTSGTVALILSLMAIGISSGDEVLVPNLTMIATPNAVRLLGGKVVLIDIDSKSLCMDVDLIEENITPKTKGLIYVSLNGRCGNIKKVQEICHNKNIVFIEDAAQSLGSYKDGAHLGTFGEMGCFSFGMHKLLTTGQGGAIITNNKDYFSKIKKLKNFGREEGGHDIHKEIGYNFRFTDLQATIGIKQIENIVYKIKRKKEIYSKYLNELSNITEIEFIETNLKETTPWFVDIFLSKPSKLQKYLKQKGIGTRLLYPAINSQNIYHSTNSLNVSKKISQKGLWLPSSLTLSCNQLSSICKHIKSFFTN